MRIAAMLGCAMGVLACERGVERVEASDLAAARSVLEANLDAIRRGDTEAYLSHYLQSPDLVATSPDGLVLGYQTLARARRLDPAWPDSFAAAEPALVWLAPGVVYGAYRYAAVQDGDASRGWSERILVKTGGGWKIAVTSVIPAPK